ncbi:murein hydrolase activator EnvC family protein [Thalassomonas actiniarum]|uniref:Peptidoglycan DD-metalloendopeptidase family protein n=1 Tax=Thalassomonas actiniarum TaxID=485447 RepID=A0AAE9YR11_9GAMM|nr:peptidoglycan DD-metalloendopeptidase family protein [Thalassomonas actiniarum]WDD99495.1 peptidoglycan DD-metalloendopeptidase family protein [Thalassomonas actiniarum]
MSLTLQLLLALLLYNLACTALAAEDNRDQDPNRQLSQIQKAIAEQKSAIAEKDKKRAQLEKQLKKDDLAVAKIARAINDTAGDYQQTQQKLTQLAKEKQQLQQQKSRQEQLLAHQLRTVYSTGHHDYLKLLLNQEQTTKIQRTLSYYQYINDARVQEIERFQTTLSSLLQVTTEHQEHSNKLLALQNTQKQQQVALQENKQKRKQTLSALKAQLLNNKQQLAKLEAEEANLVQALKELEKLVKAETNLNGLGQLKHKLSWPVKGKILHTFGSKKQGYLKWKGVLLSAPIGRQVQTIHNGTVLFSDWLKGYGLVTVIDHGNGYMSLYGHNQTLLKNVGDRVETGEVIALVGQSGGQNRSGLYFEVRHRGQAKNPKLWCQ